MTFSPPTFDQICSSVYDSKAEDVELALASKTIGFKGLASLLSPAAEPYLAQMATQSQAITQQRFGRTIQIYAPVYLSNYCSNRCAYCGFSSENNIKRRVLSLEEVAEEVDILAERGFSHIPLVSGEAPQRMGVDYLEKVAQLTRNRFASVSIEVQPLSKDEYARLFAAGITSVAV